MYPNGDAPPETRSVRYHFYKTFGKAIPPPRPYRLWWWAVVLGVVVVLYGLGTLAMLLVSSARAEYEQTQMPRYGQSLKLAMSSDRFEVGDLAQITVSFADLNMRKLPVQNLSVQVPPGFLDAFTVDEGQCTVQRGPDGRGTIRCADAVAASLENGPLAIALRASLPGNYSGSLKLSFDLLVPLPHHPWYMAVDQNGNYRLAIKRQITIGVRVVPKP